MKAFLVDDEPLALERLLECDRRPCPLERDRRLGRKGLHDGQVVRREGAVVVRRGN